MGDFTRTMGTGHVPVIALWRKAFTVLSTARGTRCGETGSDILTSLTGLYGDRNGQPISNSYRYFNPDGTSNPAVTFAYWTDGIFDPSGATPTDTAPTMVGSDGKVAPAPWTAYTRAGC